jgi:hypothetical protein
MTEANPNPCRWCGESIEAPRKGQRFCSDKHRSLWHQHQRIYPGKLEERIRAIVKEEILGFVQQFGGKEELAKG